MASALRSPGSQANHDEPVLRGVAVLVAQVGEDIGVLRLSYELAVELIG